HDRPNGKVDALNPMAKYIAGIATHSGSFSTLSSARHGVTLSLYHPNGNDCEGSSIVRPRTPPAPKFRQSGPPGSRNRRRPSHSKFRSCQLESLGCVNRKSYVIQTPLTLYPTAVRI